MNAEPAGRPERLDALPSFQRAQFAFTAHLRSPATVAKPEDVPEQRMAVYRELLFNNAESFVSNCFPVLRSLMTDAIWNALVRDFYARHVSSSPYFSEIPAEFLHYLANEKPADLAPTWPFLLELAHYEWLELVAQIAVDELPLQQSSREGNELMPAVQLRLSPVAFVEAYRYPVQQIGPGFLPSEPPEQPTLLVVYRNRADQVHFLALTAPTYQLLSKLETAGTEGLGLEDLLAGLPSEEARVAARQLLLNLIARDIVLPLQ